MAKLVNIELSLQPLGDRRVDVEVEHVIVPRLEAEFSVKRQRRIAARKGKAGDNMPSEIKPSASITRALDAETSYGSGAFCLLKRSLTRAAASCRWSARGRRQLSLSSFAGSMS